jgi:hypothetical protein
MCAASVLQQWQIVWCCYAAAACCLVVVFVGCSANCCCLCCLVVVVWRCGCKLQADVATLLLVRARQLPMKETSITTTTDIHYADDLLQEFCKFEGASAWRGFLGGLVFWWFWGWFWGFRCRFWFWFFGWFDSHVAVGGLPTAVCDSRALHRRRQHRSVHMCFD